MTNEDFPLDSPGDRTPEEGPDATETTEKTNDEPAALPEKLARDRIQQTKKLSKFIVNSLRRKTDKTRPEETGSAMSDSTETIAEPPPNAEPAEDLDKKKDDSEELEAELSDKPRKGVWHGPQGDVPITVIDRKGYGVHGGRRYVRVAESNTGIPEDEISYMPNIEESEEDQTVPVKKEGLGYRLRTAEEFVQGERVEVPEGEDGEWTFEHINPEAGTATIKKHSAEGDTIKIIPIEAFETQQNEHRDSDIPVGVIKEAKDRGLEIEALLRTREIMENPDWEDVIGFLRVVQSNPKLREHFRFFHKLEVPEPPKIEESKEAKETRLSHLALSEIEKTDPQGAKEEKARRIARNREKLFKILNTWKNYKPLMDRLPFNDIPMLPGIDVPPDMVIPEDIEGFYGVWRKLMVKTYVEKVVNDRKAVRAELKRPGGEIPLVRSIRQHLLSWSILSAEKKRARTTGRDLDYGALGLGYRRYKKIFRAIEEQDKQVVDAKRALGAMNQASFTKNNQGNPRIKLAENIVTIKERELAIKKRRELNPYIPRNSDISGQEEAHSLELVA